MEKKCVIYLCVCVCVCVCGWVRACACARVALLLEDETRRHSVIYGLWLHRIFRHNLINGTIFGGKITEYKMSFDFSLQILLETFLILIIL